MDLRIEPSDGPLFDALQLLELLLVLGVDGLQLQPVLGGCIQSLRLSPELPLLNLEQSLGLMELVGLLRPDPFLVSILLLEKLKLFIGFLKNVIIPGLSR